MRARVEVLTPDTRLQFQATVHDILTPLTIVQAHGQLVQRWTAKQTRLTGLYRSRMERSLQAIDASSHRMADLIAQLDEDSSD